MKLSAFFYRRIYFIIPLRDRNRKRISGKYRRRLSKRFDRRIYHKRNIVETVFSVLKRVYGEEIKARKFRNHVKEIKIKLILYNINKSTKIIFVLVVVEDFYKAIFLESELLNVITNLNNKGSYLKSEVLCKIRMYRACKKYMFTNTYKY
ncbi:transposase [Methanolobus sp. ZRKC3]|uniref:transposase n=1 Tax=Methanolobus sp. ZRKC3 TaxID=3125786 RepID=UPI003245DFF0